MFRWMYRYRHQFVWLVRTDITSNLGWGMGNTKAPGYLIITRKMSFLPATCNVSFVSIDTMTIMLP